MNIFRKLGCGLSKLSIHKKGSSKSKSKARICEAKYDGLIYNSPFGASFRLDPSSDLSSLAFVSPETSANRSLDASAEDLDGLEGSVNSFDKPFLEQAKQDDLRHGSKRTRSDFKAVYRKSVDATNGGDPEREIRTGKPSRAVVKDSKNIELESLPCSRKSETVDIKSQQRIQNPPEYFNIDSDSSSVGGRNERGTKFRPEDPSNIQNSETTARTKPSLASSLLDTNLDSLKSSIEEIIDCGLGFESSYKVGFEAAKEHTSRERSQLGYWRSVGNTSIPNHGVAYGHDLREICAWNIAEDEETFCIRNPVSTQFESLDNMLSLPDFPGDAQEQSVNILKQFSVDKRGSLQRRSSSLPEIDSHQKSISVFSSKRGTDSPTKAALEIPQTTLKSPGGQQLGSFQQDVAMEKSVGKRTTLRRKRPSELRTRRLAAIMCPRPYGFRNTSHLDSWDIKISDRGSSPCSGGDTCEQTSSCTKRESKLYTTSSLTVSVKGDSAGGNELQQMPYLEYPRKNWRAADKQILGFDAVESPTPVISSSESDERTEQPFQDSTHFQDSADIMLPRMSKKISKTVSSELCIATEPALSEPSPTSSHWGGNFGRHSLSKSAHHDIITRFQETATPSDILQKYTDLEEIKYYEPSKMSSVESILNDDPASERPPSVSSVAMTNPRLPCHDPPQPMFGQAFATHENSFQMEHPFSHSSYIYTKEAILRQSRKGWNTRCNQDSD